MPGPLVNPELAFNLNRGSNGNVDDVGGHALDFMSKITVINRKIVLIASIRALPMMLRENATVRS